MFFPKKSAVNQVIYSTFWSISVLFLLLFLFQALKYKLQSLQHILQSLQHMFQGLQ